VLAQASRKAFRYVARSPSPISVICWCAPQERWVKQDEIEFFALHGREQVAVTHFDLALHAIDEGIDAGASNGRRIDVHRHDATRTSRESICEAKNSPVRGTFGLNTLGVTTKGMP
jgi:hypothetical protein